jgi:hypothetical protein
MQLKDAHSTSFSSDGCVMRSPSIAVSGQPKQGTHTVGSRTVEVSHAAQTPNACFNEVAHRGIACAHVSKEVCEDSKHKRTSRNARGEGGGEELQNTYT